MDWKTFKVKVSDYLDGDNNYTADEYEAIFKAVCVECEKDGNHQIVERNGYYFVEAIPEPTLEQRSEQLRSQRNVKLKETDAYLLSDFPISDAERAEVIKYRQQLRDLPMQEGFPKNIVWPDVPEFLCEKPHENLGLAKVNL